VSHIQYPALPVFARAGDIDLHPFLGLGSPNDNAGYRNIRVNVDIDADTDAATLQVR